MFLKLKQRLRIKPVTITEEFFYVNGFFLLPLYFFFRLRWPVAWSELCYKKLHKSPLCLNSWLLLHLFSCTQCFVHYNIHFSQMDTSLRIPIHECLPTAPSCECTAESMIRTLKEKQYVVSFDLRYHLSFHLCKPQRSLEITLHNYFFQNIMKN